jgi:pilus assembly protein Flp/PilA
MTQLQNLISRFEVWRLGGFSLPRREEGQTLVEYALILVLIAVVVVVVVATLGNTIKSVFTNVASSI